MNERINAGRQHELDYARGFAILFMIAVHCLETFAMNDKIEGTAYGTTIEILGSFTCATVFMVLLGVGIVYSRKSEPMMLAKRGIALFLAGYLLNVLRGAAPMLVSWKISGSDEWIPFIAMELVWIDILQFAGLAFIFFAIAKKTGFGTPLLCVSLVSFEIINYLLKHYGFYVSDVMDYQNPTFVLAAFSGLLWGTSEISSFPFLSWIFYPIAGYLFGVFLINRNESQKKRLFFLTTALSAILLIATLFACWYLDIDYGWETDAAFYHHTILGHIVFGSAAFLMIGVIYYLSNYLPRLIKNTLERWSNNITEIYFIQWVLIGWIAVATGFNLYGVATTALITLAVMIASDYLAAQFEKMRRHSH